MFFSTELHTRNLVSKNFYVCINVQSVRASNLYSKYFPSLFRYHLQALRHLYVLAAEPRLLVPRDIESKDLVSCHVEVELCDTIWYKGRTLVMTAPVMLPELKYLKRVTIQDSRYHQV